MPERSDALDVSAVVIHYGPESLLRRLLDSLAAHRDVRMLREIVVVNNGRSLGAGAAAAVAASVPGVPVRIVDHQDTGYASGVNLGVRHSAGRVLLILNNDLEWSAEESVSPLLDALDSPGAGVAGPQLVCPDGSWQRSEGRCPSLRAALESALFLDTARDLAEARRFRRGSPAFPPRTADYVDGALMAVKRDCFDAVGGFDTAFDFYGEDADFCRRARAAGWRVLFVPGARVIHARGATSAREDAAGFERRLCAAKMRFVAKHEGRPAAVAFRLINLLALAVRAAGYSTALLVRPTPAWRQRARAARARFAAARTV